ncbi:MAG: N-6 DNA methylase [Elainellaceae cyanobacterium]
MTIRSKNIFTTVRTEGAILPADLLQRIVDGDKDLNGLSPTSYHLLEGEKLNEAINRSWSRLRGAWVSFKAALEKLPPNDPGTSVTRDRLLLPLFQELGYGRLTAAKAIEIENRNYPISHGWLHTPIHLVGWRVDLDRRTAGVAGAARSSPHSLVQELLNRSQEHLWAFLSNGRQLRILRDNVSLTRQAYVEFDLEAMMAGEVYADFVLLWLLCHQSRVETEKPEQCWLEKWSKTAQEQGTRALDQLRRGVEGAIATLGQGFLSHPVNRELRQKLQSGQLSTQDYYRQLLRLVYRLLFLFVAEDRGFLLDPKAEVAARERYTLYYSTARLRTLAEKRRGTRHADLFFGLRLVMEKLGSSEGCQELGLPALGSLLWSEAFVADVVSCQIVNADLLEAIRALAFIRDKHGRRPVDYKNLRSEELGSVYEALLELHPELNVSAGTFALTTAAGNERKTTGSYYTPESLVQCLLDSALDPVVDEAIQQADPEAAILNLKLCDPACGSGHFLIAAAHRMAKRLAAIRTGDEEPSPEATQKALRDVIGQCIYGVDVNPMAVELCKVALWMESLEPGKPLSFLEHHIQCGNSLLGATPALLRKGIPDEAFTPIEGDDKAYCSKYKKQNKQEREKGQLTLLDERNEPWERLGDLATSLVNLNQIADDDIAGVQRKQTQYEEYVKSTPYLFSRFWADAWCAAFVWKKRQSEGLLYPITDEVFRQIERNPFNAPAWMKQEVERLRDQYRFFHWHLAFPDVFQVSGEIEHELTRWSGGFNVVIGNPPWERIKLQEKEWFALYRPDIANAPNTSARRQMIAALEEEDPALLNVWLEDSRKAEGESHLIRNTGRYPLCGRGDINTYAIFAETNRLILGTFGRVGCILPCGIATDDTTKYFFQDIAKTHTIVTLLGFINEEQLFPSVLHNFKFCILVLCGSSQSIKEPSFVFNCYNVEQTKDEARQFSLSSQEIYLLNPNTGTCPVFFWKRSAEITKEIYYRVPILEREGQNNPWRISLFSMFHMSNDSKLFYTKPSEKFAPLYEAKMIHQFNHRFASYENLSEGKRSHMLPEVELTQLEDPNYKITPCYYVSLDSVNDRLRKVWAKNWLISYRETTSAGLYRTTIYSVLPIVGTSNKLPLIIFDKETESFAPSFIACMNSFALDFCSRQKLGGATFNFFIKRQLAVIPPKSFANTCSWNSSVTINNWVASRVLELTYTAWDLQPFAQDCGYGGAPFRWDEERRFLLRCELDAAYFHLYGIQRDDVDYIMETFPIVKRKDEQKHGRYRTKDKILEIYDAMAEAMKTGQPYQTLLAPPPADPSVAHSPHSELHPQ